MRFGHDDMNPAVDFIKEVGYLQELVRDKEQIMSSLAAPQDHIIARIRIAEHFRVGADPGAVFMKGRLRHLEGELALNRLEILFGTTIHSWPTPERRAPRFWHIRAIHDEHEINAALEVINRGPISLINRMTFYKQIDIGQDITEDAGGFLARAWKAMLGYYYDVAKTPYKKELI